MKGFVLAFALLAVIASVYANPEMKGFLDACKTEIGITDDKLPSPDSDDSKAKCFHACVIKKMGKMADGKLVPEKELEFASKLPGMDDAKKKKVTECVNTANSESDECEVAHAFAKCLKENDLLPPHHPQH